MWAYIKDGAIKQTNVSQTRLEINTGSYFPVKYANEWTKEQKEAYGVYEIVNDDSNFKDPDYYTNTSTTLKFASGVVTQAWGTATAKSLADVNFTQADEDNGLGTKDELNYRGLTYFHKKNISEQAHALLSPTDWYTSRKAETTTAIPTAVANFRAAVRTKAAGMHTLIDNANTTAKLIALYEYVNTADEGDDVVMERPLGEWPDPVE